MTTLASLNVPQPGKYVIWAKAFVTGGAVNSNVTCQLSAGTDVDQVQTYTQATQGWPLALIDVHEFATAGTADFQCTTGGVNVTANAIRVAAIRVNNVTNG
jgi:hypothetical protein